MTALAAANPKSNPKPYNPRHPERTLLCQTIAEHFETWHQLASAGQFDGQGEHHTPKPYVRQAFRKYFECDIFAYGFACARCADCAHDYFAAFSCKGRGVCPSCNTRRMVETVAHLTDHVFPHLPVRQWVLSVSKRQRYFMQRDGAVLNMGLGIFLRGIGQSLQTHCPGAAQIDKAALHIGAVAFIPRFGSSLNQHVHLYVCVVDGVFEAVVGGARRPKSKSKCKPLRQVSDRAALERLLRYCTRPPFAMERLRKESATLVYRCAKQHSEPSSDKRGAKADEMTLTPLELIDRIAALVRPPRTHRHRYFGVLAPNSPLRAAVTALSQAQALPAQPAAAQAGSVSAGVGVLGMDTGLPTRAEPVRPKRQAHYLWAVLMARIYEIFPLLCPLCGGQMRLIAFITHSADIRQILAHIGVESEPPRITPARRPPLWEGCDAPLGEGVQSEPDWDLAAQLTPDYEVDKRINW
ncbi:MAG: IS91 family transposase [Comamonadaceae bacterium CG1_02_60_18]|nr:MAG: IS91 family transposase [Comamonadaceae bacterium CG1_02_60_18]PIQ56705.1 MAG: IS91 family transposase [Comamonadaceae bacterium CG12_big_fil_rev_8_21_14_0_65_59_15]